MAEKEHPAVTCPIVQDDLTRGGGDGEVGGDIADMQAHD
jgi:hypothetical protein